jgi:hypothetical protein
LASNLHIRYDLFWKSCHDSETIPGGLLQGIFTLYLGKFHDSKSTHSRDKIYALLGISDDASDPKRFFPCYKKSDRRVFRDTASFLLFSEILGRDYALPDLSLLDLYDPILQLAEKTLEWTLTYGFMPHRDEERDDHYELIDSENAAACRRTAKILVDKLNEGQFKTQDFLLSLAEKRGRTKEIQTLLTTTRESVRLGLVFKATDPSKSTLTVSLGKCKAPKAYFQYTSKNAANKLPSAPFSPGDDLIWRIKDLRCSHSHSARAALFRAHVWKGNVAEARKLALTGINQTG